MTSQPIIQPDGRRLSARHLVAGVAAATLALGLAIVVSPAASADPGPVASRSSTGVTADALPTAQIDGVVWSQAVNGNTVYAGGSFANARPAGAAAGVNTVTRNNLLAYNITTGALISSFAPSLNAQVKAVALSPDGTRLYVGGSFTTADGQNRYRIAAYNTATGTLVSSFAPGVDATVNAIVATNTTVYIGGAFSNANNVPRARLAAFSAADGSLLGWAPTADNNEVEAMVMAPAGDKLIVGGSFTTLNGSAAGYGLGALDPSTGALVPWAAAGVVQDAGTAAAVLSLSTDGTAIYGSGYVYGAGGNLEGAFSANPSTGAINWIEDCHGDTYGTFPVNGVVYTVSHAHDCARTGNYPDTNPRQFQRALAWTANATGTLLHNQVSGYTDWGGQPSPSMINWFPLLEPGTVTGESQAAWSVSGNSQYVVLGGEFPSVNGVAQQGLVRFAVPSIAPDKQGPMVSGALYTTTETALSGNSVRVSWPANWDRDDQTLTYQLIRDGDTNHPIYTTTAVSQFYNLPTLSYVDTGLQPNSTHNYFVRVTDPDGNTVRGDYTTVTTTATSTSAYSQQVLSDGASSYWRLDEVAGATTARDFAGSSPLTEQSGVAEGTAGAIIGDSDTAATFSGTSSGSASTSTAIAGPNVFSLEAWVKTATKSGGKIIGFGSSKTGSSANYDRQITMDNSGHLVFTVYPGAVQSVATSGTYNNNAWHQVVATLSSAGMKLYVDGALAGSNATTSAQAYTGYWRVGGDNVSGTPSAPSSAYFAGAIDEVAVYPTALSLATVQAHYVKSGRTVTGTAAPTAAFTSSCTGLTCAFDASISAATSGATISAYAWNFGDGSSGTGAKPTHAYAAAGSYPVTVTVTDSRGGTASVTKSVVVSKPVKPTVAFTSSCTNLTCTFDASGSSATGATVTSYAWTYGDNASGTGVKPSHVYTAAGTFTVTLTVLDSNNSAATVSRTVTATAAPAAPTAAFTSSCTNLSCVFDASGSTVSAGATVSSYAWTWGDNTTGTGVKPTHAFAKAGSYTVTLAVKDSASRVGSVSKSVTVTAAATTLAADTFTRSLAAGWGSADTGGAWDVDDAGAFAVANGQGQITLAGAGTTESAGLDAVSATNLNMLFDVSMSKAATGNGLLTSMAVRHTSTGEYRLKVRFLSDGSVHLVVSKYTSAEGETVIREVAIAGLTYTPNQQLRVRLQISGTGTTTIAGKVWVAGSAEPAASQVTVTDNEPSLQSAGSIAVLSYLAANATNAPVVAGLDNLSATGS